MKASEAIKLLSKLHPDTRLVFRADWGDVCPSDLTVKSLAEIKEDPSECYEEWEREAHGQTHVVWV